LEKSSTQQWHASGTPAARGSSPKLRVEGKRPCSIYAVFDGHGKKGHDVSNFVKENLPKLIVKDPRFMTDQMDKMLVDCFKKMQSLVSSADHMKMVSAQLSGTTCTLAIHDIQKGKITLAHVADSSAVLSKRAGNKCRGVPLTRDHKPNLPDERKRIESGGGRVVFDGYANHRVYAKNAVYPGLNMSRCLGDLMGHNDCGLSCEPEVTVRELSAEDTTLLICSDGVWEFMSPDDAVGIVSTYTPDQAMAAAEKLAKEAWDRWIRQLGGSVVDDITVLLVHLEQKQ
jgi:serine/threonine protein phosphatase PrpC